MRKKTTLNNHQRIESIFRKDLIYTFSNYLCSIRFCIQFHFIDPNKLQFIMTKKPFIIPIRSYTLLCYRLFVIRREDEI